VITDEVKSDRMITAFQNQVHEGAVVLMAQDFQGAPVFYSRADIVRRLRAKPEKIIVDVLSGEPQFVKHTLHGDADGLVMPVEWGWILCSVRPSKSLRSGE